MADSNILKPLGENGEGTCPIPEENCNHDDLLKTSNMLSEFDGKQETIQENLNIYSKDEVYTKQEVDEKLTSDIKTSITKHAADEDVHNIQKRIIDATKDLIKNNGDTPFIKPQGGVKPEQKSDLTTKEYVDTNLEKHINDKSDPHEVMTKVNKRLDDYALKSQVPPKNTVYTKNEIDNKLNDFVTTDGKNRFTGPILGVTPTMPRHLSTKDYVDKTMNEHNIKPDPHGFEDKLYKELNKYARYEDVYLKTQTMTAGEIRDAIRELTSNQIHNMLVSHMEVKDPHGVQKEIEELLKNGYVKVDGTTPFTSPQKGVEAISDEDLVTLKQINDKIKEFSHDINDNVTWITSGPVDITVGYVNEDDVLPDEMTMQEIMDAIFYGKGANLIAPASAVVGSTVEVTMIIHGTLGLVDMVELFQDDKLLGTYTKEDFRDCNEAKETSDPIFKNTTFKMVVHYTNGTTTTATAETLVAYGMFTGIIPKWMPGDTVTYKFLTDLVKEDPKNNELHADLDDVKEITTDYDFDSPKEQKKIIVAIPVEYPDLKSMKTASQEFSVDAFKKIEAIPFNIENVEKPVMYKLFLYDVPLIGLKSEVTFKFE